MKLQRLYSLPEDSQTEGLNKERLISGIVGGIGAGTILSGEKSKLLRTKKRHSPEVFKRYLKTLKKSPLKAVGKSKAALIGTGLAAGSGYLISKELSKPKVRKDAIDYVKKNPDEAAVVVGSYTIPSLVGAKLMKSGHKKLGGAIMASTALPIGEGYILGKKAIKSSMKKDSKK